MRRRSVAAKGYRKSKTNCQELMILFFRMNAVFLFCALVDYLASSNFVFRVD